MYLDIPIFGQAEKAKPKKTQIINMLLNGKHTRVIANKLKVTEMYVRSVRREIKNR